MEHDKHRLPPSSPWYLSLFLECPLATFTVTLLFVFDKVHRAEEKGKRKEGV